MKSDYEQVIEILMRRDDMTKAEAQELIEDAREDVRDGADPEEACAEWFGLEPDYAFIFCDDL